MSRRTENNPFEESPIERERSRRPRREARDEVPRRRRKWPYVLLFLLLLLFLLPNLIGWFGLQQQAMNWALKDFKGKVKVEKLSLGWLQPISAENISAVDESGQPLLQVASFKTDKPLYSFITATDYGTVDVNSPIVYLHLRPDGSNLEDAIENYIAAPQSPLDPKPNPESKSTAPLPKLIAKIHAGAAVVTTSSSQDTWQVESLNAVAELSSAAAPLAASAQCEVTSLSVDDSGQSQVNSTGQIMIKTALDRGAKQITGMAADLDLETVGFPVSLVAPIAQRFIGPANAIGTLDSKVVASYNGRTQHVAADIQSLELSGAGVAAPDLLGQDRFFVQSLTAFGKMELSPETVSAEKFAVATDFGKVKADGAFDLRQLSDLANIGQGGQLLATPFQMDGEVDLAKLAQLLPSTLHIHNDMTVNSGMARFQVASQNDAGARRLVVNLDTANISANRGGQAIVWQKPLRLVSTIQESDGQFAIENLQCESDFLNITGKGNVRGGMFTANGDLAKLTQRVGQFVDLGQMQAGGLLKGECGWQVAADENTPLTEIANRPIQIVGNFTVDKPVLQMPDLPVWRPSQLIVQLSASGQANADQTLALSQGGVQVDIGTERVIASLAQPVVDAYTNEQWILNTSVAGQVEGWLNHARNFVDLGDMRGAGSLNLACLSKLTMNQVELDKVQYEIQNFGFKGYGVTIIEPRVVGTANVGYDLNSGLTTVPQATLAAKSVTASAQDIRFAYTDTMKLDGSAAFKADVNSLADWIEMSPTPDSIFWFGVADGTVQFASGEQGTSALLQSKLTDMVAALQSPPQQAAQTSTIQQTSATTNTNGWSELWREPNVDVNSQFTLANDFNAIAFDSLTVKSDSIDLDTTGSIDDLAGSLVTNLNGTWRPNFNKVNSLLDAYTEGAVRLAGNETQPFEMRGPLFLNAQESAVSNAWIPATLAARARLKLDGGSVMGIPIGATDFEVDLQQQMADLKTSGVPFSGGVISVNPRVDLRTDNPVIMLDESRLLDGVALTPDTVRTFMKYVAPLVADATAAQGTFTVDSQGIKVPAFDPMNLTARGTVTMQDVVIGAGPTAEQLLGVVKQLKAILKPGDESNRDLNTWIKLDEQQVPIAVENQRVFHDGIKFSHDEIQIRTKGSVGFDQTLNMVADIPIVDDWIAGKSYLASLQGKSISIPITGTVRKPILDRRAIQTLSTQLVKDAASGAINQAIQDKLAPKLGQYQNELNSKIGGEVNKLQEQFQGKLGGLLQNKLGVPGATGQNAAGAQGSAAAQGGTAPTAQGLGDVQQNLEQKLNDELKKGIGNLFGK